MVFGRTWGDRPPARGAAGYGGNAPMRPDELLARPQTRAGSGPAPQNAVVVARKVIIVGPTGELLIYNPTAAAGNLTESGSAVQGTDAAGNEILPGFTTYANAAGVFYAGQLVSGALLFDLATSEAGPYTPEASVGIDSAGDLVLQSINGIIRAVSDMQAAAGLSVGDGAGHIAVVTGQTIFPAGLTSQEVTSAGNVTGVILSPGTQDCELFFLVSHNTVSTITFAAAGSNISQNSFVVQPLTAYLFLWSADTSLWYPVS
jgi:hypothetical protein